MPLLKDRFWISLGSDLKNKHENGTYVIEYSGEQFSSREDYEKTCVLYKEHIWTCQCTGHTNLTHREAFDSEEKTRHEVSGQFPEVFKKTVLDIVHHSTDPLDFLVEKVSKKIHEHLIVSEPALLKIQSGAKTLAGVVVKQERANACKSEKSGAASPSSDKENKDHSPSKTPSPQLSNDYKYNFKLEKDKVISGVPAYDLARTTKVPNKQSFRVFIRCFAWRSGASQTSPWVVAPDMAKKYQIKNKLADLFFSPKKMKDVSRKTFADAMKDCDKVYTASSRDKSPKKVAEPFKSSKKISKPTNSTIKATSSKSDKHTSSKSAPSRHTHTKSMPSKSTANKDTPSKSTPSKSTPSNHSPSKSTANKDTPSKSTPSKSTPSKSTPSKSTPSKHTPSKSTPSKSTPSKSTPSKHTPSKSTPSKHTPSKSTVKHTPKSTPRKADDTSDSEEEISLAELKARSPLKTPSKQPEVSSPPKKKKGRPKKESIEKSDKKEKKRDKKKDTDDSDDNLVLSKLKEKMKIPGSKKMKLGKESLSKDGKKMKQPTLFEMAGRKPSGFKSPLKKSLSSSALKSPKKRTLKPAEQPLIIIRLQKALKKPDSVQSVVTKLALRCAREVTAKQRKHLPDDVRELVEDKIQKIEEKNKIASMSTEEKAEYYKKKRIEKEKEQKHKRRKFEETELKLTELPAPRLVATPEGVPNELFGDITMITEFMSTYKGLLLPDEHLPVNSLTLVSALSQEGKGFAYLNRVISILLQTLLQDDIASDYKELDVKLSDVAINEYTSSELLRLCLRTHDSHDVSSASSDSSDDEPEVEIPDELIDELETTELHNLSTSSKLQLLTCLSHRVMNTYSVQDYMTEKLNHASELWRERAKVLKEKNDLLKKEKEKIKLDKEKKANKLDTAKQKEEKREENGQVTLDTFYGSSIDSSVDDSDKDDLATVVKRRRILAARAAEQRHVKEREERMRRAKETEAQRKERELEQFKKQFEEGVLLSKLVQRVQPIGTDRNHNRYWVFSESTPGLYVEKGWAWKDIDYSVQTCEQEIDSDSSSSDSDNEDNNEENNKVKKKIKVYKCKDKTVPRVGQNLWFHYDDIADVYKLQGSLHPQGVREAKLKAEIAKHYEAIKTNLAKHQKSGALEESKGTDDLIEGFREELNDMEQRIRLGGLGGPADEAAWDKQLENAKTIPAFGHLMKDLQDSILEKFLGGMILKMGKRSKLEQLEKIKSEPNSDDESQTTPEKSNAVKTADEIVKTEPEVTSQDDLVPVGKIQWMHAIDTCTTWSRLHVLLAILDSCIKWEKSAENAKCRVCRRKGDENGLLLCDDCNGAFHMYCLRPALFEVPIGDWYCPACKPPEQRRKAREVKYPAESQQDSDDQDIKHDTQCVLCEGEDELILCSTCPSAFHKDCHEPPIRRRTAPRSNWRCCQCITGIRYRKSKRAAAKKRKRYDDDFVEDWEEGYDEKPKPKRTKPDDDVIDDPYGSKCKNDTSKSRAERYANRTRDVDFTASESEAAADSEEEEEEAENEDDGLDKYITHGRSRATTSRATTSRKPNTSHAAQDTSDSDSDADDASPRTKQTRKYKTKPKREIEPRELLKINVDQVLMRLRRNRYSWPFQDPVDPKLVPDYYDIVKQPMDLLTMKCKCECSEYETADEFVRDLAQIFHNCELYNKPDSDICKCIIPLEKLVRESLQKFLPDVKYTRDQENSTAIFSPRTSKCLANGRNIPQVKLEKLIPDKVVPNGTHNGTLPGRFSLVDHDYLSST